MYRKFERPNRIIFQTRDIGLQRLERSLLSRKAPFVLSTRHRDMLRCSITKHFKSCYAPNGCNSHIPFELCKSPSWAIIGEKDKAGDFIWRAFARYYYSNNGERYWDNSGPFSSLTIYKFYGNCPFGIKETIVDYLRDYVDTVKFECYHDAY